MALKVRESTNNRLFLTKLPGESDIITRIVSFMSLKRGWHYGRGVSPSGDTVRGAMEAVSILRAVGLKAFEAFPGVEGEVLVSGYAPGVSVEVTILSDGRSEYVVNLKSSG